MKSAQLRVPSIWNNIGLSVSSSFFFIVLAPINGISSDILQSLSPFLTGTIMNQHLPVQNTGLEKIAFPPVLGEPSYSYGPEPVWDPVCSVYSHGIRAPVSLWAVHKRVKMMFPMCDAAVVLLFSSLFWLTCYFKFFRM